MPLSQSSLQSSEQALTSGITEPGHTPVRSWNNKTSPYSRDDNASPPGVTELVLTPGTEHALSMGDRASPRSRDGRASPHSRDIYE